MDFQPHITQLKVGLTVNPLDPEEAVSFEYESVEVDTTDIIIQYNGGERKEGRGGERGGQGR